jgi:hypothetical protein
MDTEFLRIARQDGTDVSGTAVQEDHGLLAMAFEEQSVNGSCIGIPDDNPEAQSPKPLTHTLPHERQRVISLRLDDGKAVLGCDTDVGFQHDKLIARKGCAIQLPIMFKKPQIGKSLKCQLGVAGHALVAKSGKDFAFTSRLFRAEFQDGPFGVPKVRLGPRLGPFSRRQVRAASPAGGLISE